MERRCEDADPPSVRRDVLRNLILRALDQDLRQSVGDGLGDGAGAFLDRPRRLAFSLALNGIAMINVGVAQADGETEPGFRLSP